MNVKHGDYVKIKGQRLFYWVKGIEFDKARPCLPHQLHLSTMKNPNRRGICCDWYLVRPADVVVLRRR